MNKKLLDKIATWLEGGAKHDRLTFDMATGIRIRTEHGVDPTPDDLTRCNSSCCIAGAAVEFSKRAMVKAKNEMKFHSFNEEGEDRYEAPWWVVRDQAQEVLQLDVRTANRLFKPWDYGGPYGTLGAYTNPAWAARVIRKLMATGEVDWIGTEEVEEATA